MTDSNTNARNVGKEAGKDAKRSAERLAEDARSTAEDLSGRAREEAWSQAERARGGVATEMSGIADALRKAAQEMRSGSPQERTFGQIAESLADASDTIRDRDVGELASDVSRFARRNPLAFLGGAALAGFAVTRFAKASAPGSRGTDIGATARPEGGSAPSGAPGSENIPAPATTPATTTPGTGASATATPSPTATKTTGDY
ncbi:hypothetical protein [Palleronia sp.]|uniref:hypothetical protein n=1 Tax=Palleronia sp. TaxID=1940284 RepID=UPI0035C87897